jgi:hypothetical protein
MRRRGAHPGQMFVAVDAAAVHCETKFDDVSSGIVRRVPADSELEMPHRST